MDTSSFSPEQILNAINGGKTTTPDQVAHHLQSAGAKGFELYLGVLFYIVLFAVVIGITLVIVGVITNSKSLRNWGLSSIILPMVMFGGSFFIPMVLTWIKHFSTVTIFQ